MTDLPNQVRAYDRVDVMDDIIHYIHEYPRPISPTELNEDEYYYWDKHMDINPITGEVHVDRLPNMKCRPSNGEHFSFPFKVAATDGLNVTIQDVTFEVNHVPEPVVVGSGQQTQFHVVEGQPFSATFAAFDPELNCPVANPLAPTFSVNGIPFTMSSSGVLTGTVPENPTSNVVTRPFTVRITSRMSGLVTDLECALHITNNNQGPVWVSPSAYSVLPEPWSVALQATDREGDAITYSIVSGNGFTLNGSTLSRTFSAVGSYVVTVRATDARGAFTNQTITVNVNAFPNPAPVWVTPAGRIADTGGGAAFTFQFQATDTELVQYSITSGALPAGLSMNSAGRVSGTISQVAEGAHDYNFTVTATDGVNTVPRTFSMRVSRTNQPPVWNISAGTVFDVYPSQNFDRQLVATDPEGAPITYSASIPSSLSWLTLTPQGRLHGRVPIGAVDNGQAIAFTAVASDGSYTASQQFFIRIRNVAPQTVNFPSTTDWVVPAGVYQIMAHWIVGGGGGGGAGHEMGHGGGGAGGGSGGHLRRVAIDVVPNQTVRFEIGTGGEGFWGSAGVTGYGGTGGATRILVNGNVRQAVTGGGGGQTSPNFNKGYLGTTAGAGGSPSGISGVAGQVGTNDKFSAVGGAGGRGPIIGASGGAGGQASGGNNYTTGPSAGKNGIGFGSGGGGGGSHDRINRSTTYWKGGNGSNGVVEITFPSIPPAQYENDENHPHFGMKPWVYVAPPVNPNPGGGGGGGGGCCWDEALLPSGKRMREVMVGDPIILMNDDGDGHKNSTVEGIRPSVEQCYTLVTESGIRLTCSDSTPIIIKGSNGRPKGVTLDPMALLMEMVPVLDNGEYRWEYITDVVDAGVLPVRILSANNGVYAAGNEEGRYIFTHNAVFEGDMKHLV